MRHIKLYWDPDRELFMDEDGFEWTYVCRWLPSWALELAKIHRSKGDDCFAYNLDAATFVEIFWPSEEEENWYL